MVDKSKKIVKVILTGFLLLGLNACTDKIDNETVTKEGKKHHLGGFYYADDKQIYIQGEHHTFVPFDTVDYESFQVLNQSNYSKDKNGIYYHEFVIEQPTVDFDSQVKNVNLETFKALNDEYAKNEEHIFYHRDILKGADVDTFVVLGKHYAKDKLSVYYGNEVIEGANPNTFVVYSEKKLFAMAKDDKHAYVATYQIKDINIDTFVPLGTIYFKDDKNIYCIDRGEGDKNLITDFDYDTFETLESGLYAKDKNGVYSIYSGECHKRSRLLMPNIDPQTVKEVYVNLTTFSIFKDKNHVYNDYGIIKGADPKSFVLLSDEYFRDKDYVYSCERRLTGVDPDGFDAKSFNYRIWADKYDVLEEE